MIPQKVRLYVI